MAEDKQPTPHDELYAYMSAKDTDELVEIYQENDVEGRSKESLEIVRQILLERLGTLPEKEPEEQDEEVPAEEEYEFPQDKVLYRIADWSGRLSVWVLTVIILNVVLKLGRYFTFGLPLSEWNDVAVFDVIITVLSQLEVVLYGGFLYLVLLAVTEIIYVLMDIRDLFQATEKANGESV